MYQVYWQDRQRNVYSGYVKARTPDEAYNFAQRIIGRAQVTSVYKVPNGFRDPFVACLNFGNRTTGKENDNVL